MAASDTPADLSVAERIQGLDAQRPPPQMRTAQTSSTQQSRRPSDKHSPSSPGPLAQKPETQPDLASIEAQLAKVQTFCVYASELVDTQREDINRVSAAVERIEDELKSFKEFLRGMREEQRAIPREQKSNGITSEEIDLLTSSMGEIGRKANEVDALKLELAMMKGKIKRLENAFQPYATTDGSGPSQARDQGAPEHTAKRGFAVSAPNSQELNGQEHINRSGMPNGKSKRHISPSGEAAAYRRDDSRHHVSNPPHSSPISLRPRRPEQLRPYLAASSLFGDGDDDGGIVSGYGPESSVSPQSSRGRAGRARAGPGRPSIRGRGHSTGRPRGRRPNPAKALLRERGGPGIKDVIGHRASSGAIDEATSNASSFIKQEEEAQLRSKASMQALSQKKENLKLTNHENVENRGHHLRPEKRRRQEQASSQDEGEDLTQDDAIRAREKALDEEWEREYGLRDQ